MFVKFTQQEIEKCQEFANKIDTRFYATRNQSNNDKRIKDQIFGKLGEIATFNSFKDKGIELTEPDFNIYGKNKKSWDFDLKGKDLNLHVKSQSISQSKKYGESWMFERNDRHVFKDISENDYVCFVIIDQDNKIAEIKAIVKLTDLHKYNLFEKPKLSYLTSKSAVYFTSLQKSFKENLFCK